MTEFSNVMIEYSNVVNNIWEELSVEYHVNDIAEFHLNTTSELITLFSNVADASAMFANIMTLTKSQMISVPVGNRYFVLMTMEQFMMMIVECPDIAEFKRIMTVLIKHEIGHIIDFSNHENPIEYSITSGSEEYSMLLNCEFEPGTSEYIKYYHSEIPLERIANEIVGNNWEDFMIRRPA